MSVAVLSPRDVPTTLNYFASTDDTQAPFSYVNPRPDQPRTNVGAEPHPAVVHDARNKESEIGLDKTGFNFVTWPSVEKDFVDDEKIKREYYPEVEAVLKTHVGGAKRVFIFDHTIRRAPPGDGVGTPGARGPALQVHVDQTFEAGFERVRYHLPDEAERLLKGRVRIINLWRPIANPVAHTPLAVADYRSIVPTEDLIATRLIYPHREGSIFSVKYRPEHQWWYLSDQTPDEVTLIKCFDSEDKEGTARLTPHTAFVDKSSPASAPLRQSIEVRALVFDLE